MSFDRRVAILSTKPMLENFEFSAVKCYFCCKYVASVNYYALQFMNTVKKISGQSKIIGMQ